MPFPSLIKNYFHPVSYSLDFIEIHFTRFSSLLGQFLKCVSSPSCAYQPRLSQCCLMCCSSLTSLLTLLCAPKTTFLSLICVLLSFSLPGEVLQNYLVLKILGVIQVQMMASLSSAFLLLTFLTYIFFSASLSDTLSRNVFQLMLRISQHIFLKFLSICLEFRVKRKNNLICHFQLKILLSLTSHPLCCLHSALPF